MKKSLIVGVALASAFLLYYAFYNMPTGATTLTRQIQTGATVIAVEVADSDTARERGLSGRAGLKEGAGMLFVFDKEGSWGIWMKGMQFPLDIIWTNATGTIITIAHNVSPDTYPTIFYPAQATALYVLEVPAGFAKKQGIVEGTKIQL